MKPVYRCRVCGEFTENPVHCGKHADLILDGVKRLRLSKLMSFILRHCPECVGLKLDSEGWVRVEDLVNAIKERWRNKEAYNWLDVIHVIAVAALDPKGRFELRNGLIRARYGHQSRLGVRIEYECDEHTKTLFHGTSSRNLASILREGVKPMRRSYVHLATSMTDACEVGARHGPDPVVLVIDADCLRKLGYRVYVASHSVRLVDYVPPECIAKVLRCLDKR